MTYYWLIEGLKSGRPTTIETPDGPIRGVVILGVEAADDSRSVWDVAYRLGSGRKRHKAIVKTPD